MLLWIGYSEHVGRFDMNSRVKGRHCLCGENTFGAKFCVVRVTRYFQELVGVSGGGRRALRR